MWVDASVGTVFAIEISDPIYKPGVVALAQTLVLGERQEDKIPGSS